MKSLGRRTIQYAGNAIALEYDNPAAEELLDSIIYSFPSPTNSKPSSTIRVEITDSLERSYSIILDGNQIYKSLNNVDFAEMLLSKICYQLAFDSRDGMLFHAAGLGFNHIGVQIPGGIGYGKSTFTAWMVANGCDYFSDEFVYFPWETETMISFSRPIHLKKSSRNVLSSLIDYGADTSLVKVGTNSDLVNPLLLNPDNKYSQPPVNLILFPRYETGAELDWRPLSSAETGLELMKFLINARNLPDHGFNEIARLARATKGIKFTYSSFEQIEKNIKGILDNF